MAILDIQIHGRTHQIACDDGQETHVRALAAEIDEQVHHFAESMNGKATEQTLLLLTALMLADESRELRTTNKKLKAQLQDHSHSFEQAKELVIEQRVAETIDDIALEIATVAKAIENSAA